MHSQGLWQVMVLTVVIATVGRIGVHRQPLPPVVLVAG
jgi:hypothetical protein